MKTAKVILIGVAGSLITAIILFSITAFKNDAVDKVQHDNEIQQLDNKIETVRVEVKEKNKNINKYIDTVNDLNRTDHKEIKEDVVVIKEDIAFIKGMLIRMNNRDLTANK